MLLSTVSTSLTEQLTVRLAQRIQTPLLMPGVSHPLVRRCAMVRSIYPADPHAGHALGN